MPETDPLLTEEEAAVKWGPTLADALWKLENHFPGFGWNIGQQRFPHAYAYEASIRVPVHGQYLTCRRFDGDSKADPVWALCLAMEAAARGGFYQPIPPAPPPPVDAAQ